MGSWEALDIDVMSSWYISYWRHTSIVFHFYLGIFNAILPPWTVKMMKKQRVSYLHGHISDSIIQFGARKHSFHFSLCKNKFLIIRPGRRDTNHATDFSNHNSTNSECSSPSFAEFSVSGLVDDVLSTASTQVLFTFIGEKMRFFFCF